MTTARTPERRPASVWLAPGSEGLVRILSKLGAEIETGERPSPHALILLAPLGEDASAATVRLGLDAARVVAVDPLFGLDSHRTLMTTPATAHDMRDAAHGLLATDGVPVSVVRDSPGFVVQRVVAAIVNIGCDIAQQRIATPADIDRAVTLGLGYPKGPLAWGDAIGPAKVLAVLDAMLSLTGDPRYRPSPWLRRRATLGLSLLTED